MDVAAFLRQHPPFDSLSDESLERIAGGVKVEFFLVGSVIIHEAGEPARFLYVIRRGAVEVLDEDRVLDVLGEGEAFGHLSLLSGLSPTATIRAAEETLCYLIDAEMAEHVLGTRRGLAFVSSTLRRQLMQVGDTGRGDRADPRFVASATLIRRRPVTCPPTTTVREAAEIMARERVSSLLVEHQGSWGILTDHDLRSRVLAAGRSPDARVADVMTHPARTVQADSMAADVLRMALETEFHHYPVTDSTGRLLGVLTDTDLLRLERYTPFALRSAIERAPSEAEAIATGRELPRVVAALMEAHADPVDVGHVVGVTIDALTRRLVDTAIAGVGPPPTAWAWIALGSAARHEQGLRTDQDHALAFDPPNGGTEEADAYFGTLATRVSDGLEAVGIARCAGGAMAENPQMRRSLNGWVDAFRGWMNDPGRTGSIFTSIVFDFRRVTGALDVEAALDPLMLEASGNRDFINHLGRRALDRRPPTGFRGDLVLENRGQHAGRLDVKHGGITLITNLGRAYGIAAGLTERRTIQRLRGAADAGTLEEELEAGLEEAFRLLWEIRLRHQVSCIQAGQEPDDFVDPTTLGPLTRRGLKEAFHFIARAQRALAADLGVPWR